MVETEKIETLKAIFEHKTIEELLSTLLRCNSNVEEAVEALLLESNSTRSASLADATRNDRHHIETLPSSCGAFNVDGHCRDTLVPHATIAFLPLPPPQPFITSTSLQFDNDLEMAKKLAERFDAENEVALSKPTMVRMDTKRPPATLRERPFDRMPRWQQQRRQCPGRFDCPAKRFLHQQGSTNAKTIDFSSSLSDEAQPSHALERSAGAAQADKMDEHDEDLRSALAASMAPSDLGRLGGFGKEMTTYDSRALKMLLSDPDFISSLDDDFRTAIELQQKIDAEERSINFATGAASKEYPGSLAPPINTDSVSCKENKARNIDRCYNIAESTKARLLRLIQHRIENQRHQKLASQLEEMDEETQLDELHQTKKEAESLCLDIMKNHLNQFLEQNPKGSYEEWIGELHPENVREDQLLERSGKIIDHRFYAEESDHRKLWNERVNADAAKSHAPQDKIMNEELLLERT